MIKKIVIQNFKVFENFVLDLNSEINLIVGDNESGKSTILEAIQLALTKRIAGRTAEQELSPFLFNSVCVQKYIAALRGGANPEPPHIRIELYLESSEELARWRGSNNTEKVDAAGVKVEIELDEEFRADYEAVIREQRTAIRSIPVEFYRINWYSFANEALSRVPLALSNIDASTIRLQGGTDYYLQGIISGSLDEKQRAAVAIAYRKLKEELSSGAALKNVNEAMAQKKGTISQKNLSIALDISQKSGWESALVPYLDGVPFGFIGKGEQSAVKIMLALERHAKESQVVLIEEPENHLSYSSMNTLIRRITDKCAGKQILIVTHSAYVLNKLGIENVQFLHAQRVTSLSKLNADTREYFRKLSGYDTLRLILAKKAILVEGPSDELMVHKVYSMQNGRAPYEDGVDVINVRGLSFPRFLDISRALGKETVVVTDNDGNYEKNVVERYSRYKDCPFIRVAADPDNNARTLELQILKANELEVLNTALGTDFEDKQTLGEHMIANKTSCALKLFDSDVPLTFPAYIKNALS